MGWVPHSVLLTRSELEPAADGVRSLAVLASSGSRENVLRSGTVDLIAIDGLQRHHVKLGLINTIDNGDLLGCAFEVMSHKRDDIGVPMQPLTFCATAEIVVQADWTSRRSLLARLDRQAEQEES
ncbi:hypothetical protein ACFRCI_46500 [Streptomyces sp. NPDC056638]|uniref:hypothetical protein n=1 Tax=Streptomyces sp. NPDC056638 TaxID=3345887 RepID=UPI0036B439D6